MTERDFIEQVIEDKLNKIIVEGLILRELIAARPMEKRLRRIEHMGERAMNTDRRRKHNGIHRKNRR